MNALKRAAEILREDAESIRQSHTLSGDWQSEDKAKAEHDEMMAVAEQLDALQQTAPAVPEGFDVRRNSDGDIIVTRLSDRGAAAYIKDSPLATVVMGWHFLDALLAAAPQPDHSPDAGKVVDVECCCENPEPEEGPAMVSNCCPIHNVFPQHCDNCSQDDTPAPATDGGEVEPVGWSGWACHKAGTMPRLYGDKSIAELNCDTANGESLVFLSAHSAQPRNEDAEAREEIKADAERYRWLKAQYHREYCPLTIAQRVAGGLFEWAVEDPSSAIDAARLRSNGGE